LLTLVLVMAGGCSQDRWGSSPADATEQARRRVHDEFEADPRAATAKYRALWSGNTRLNNVVRLAMAQRLVETDAAHAKEYVDFAQAQSASKDPELAAYGLQVLGGAADAASLQVLVRHLDDTRPVVAKLARESIGYRRARARLAAPEDGPRVDAAIRAWCGPRTHDDSHLCGAR